MHCAQHVERVIAQDAYAKQKQLHDQAARVLNTHVDELKAEVAALERKIELILDHKRRIEEEVLLTRRCFQEFIDSVRPFEPGKSEYVMPPLRMHRTDSLLEFELPKPTNNNKNNNNGNKTWSLPYGSMAEK